MAHHEFAAGVSRPADLAQTAMRTSQKRASTTERMADEVGDDARGGRYLMVGLWALFTLWEFRGGTTFAFFLFLAPLGSFALLALFVFDADLPQVFDQPRWRRSSYRDFQLGEARHIRGRFWVFVEVRAHGVATVSGGRKAVGEREFTGAQRCSCIGDQPCGSRERSWFARWSKGAAPAPRFHEGKQSVRAIGRAGDFDAERFTRRRSGWNRYFQRLRAGDARNRQRHG